MALTLDDAKAHLNVTTDFDDALITAKLAAAKEWIYNYTGTDPDISGGAPAPILEAVLILTAQLYDNREITTQAGAQQLPFGFLDLLERYRGWRF